MRREGELFLACGEVYVRPWLVRPLARPCGGAGEGAMPLPVPCAAHLMTAILVAMPLLPSGEEAMTK